MSANHSYPYPVLIENGLATHVMVPVEHFARYLRMDKRANRVTIPSDVAFMVAEGTNPLTGDTA